MRSSLIRIAAVAGIGLGGVGATLIAGCSTTQIASGESTIQNLLTEAQAAINLGLVPTADAGLASLIVTGLQGLLNTETASVASGATTESNVLTSLSKAVATVEMDVPAGSQTATDAAQAQLLLTELQGNQSATTKAQVEGAVGLVLADYLQIKAPTSATMGAAPSALQSHIANVRADAVRLQAE